MELTQTSERIDQFWWKSTFSSSTQILHLKTRYLQAHHIKHYSQKLLQLKQSNFSNNNIMNMYYVLQNKTENVLAHFVCLIPQNVLRSLLLIFTFWYPVRCSCIITLKTWLLTTNKYLYIFEKSFSYLPEQR